jgi:hypothetical protein
MFNMGRTAFALLAVLVVSGAGAARGAAVPAPVVGHDVRHDLSPPLFLMPLRSDADVVSSTHQPLPLPKAHARAASASAEAEPAALPSPAAGPFAMPSPDLAFDGIVNRNNVAPPDANGDVGPNHYVQWVNLSYAVWDKHGTLLYGPVNGNTLWNGFGGMCETRNNGDPIALYDPLADRWLLSQLALIDPSEYHQCIAISQSPDPTGAWYRYDFLFSTSLLNDYPKFGVWPDGYYLAINQYQGVAPRVFAGQGVMAFERDAMLQGISAQTVYFNLFGVNPNYGGAMPSDLDGPVPPPAGAPNVFAEVDDDSFGWTPIDRLSLWSFHVDWAQPQLSTFGSGGDPDQVIDLGAAGYPFDSNMCGYSDQCIPQPGTPARIDALSDRLMYRLAYRRWPDHESLTVNHTVDVDGTDHAGVRWYELDRSGGAWSIGQAGTYAPDGQNRWMASAAMDGSGDLAIGYSIGSATLSPSIRYAGRLAGDPPGTLPLAETTLVAGSGAQTALSRWGDYSMLAVDPVDDCTFWYTQEYYAAVSGNGWSTRVGSFRIPQCVSCALVGRAVLDVDEAGAGVSLTWTAADNATGYDVVTGDLVVLRSTGGDFSQAVTGCVVDGSASTSAVLADPGPAPGGGIFYLVRSIGTRCVGTYDDGSPSQQTGRDAGLAAAPAACP